MYVHRVDSEQSPSCRVTDLRDRVEPLDERGGVRRGHHAAEHLFRFALCDVVSRLRWVGAADRSSSAVRRRRSSRMPVHTMRGENAGTDTSSG